MNTDNLIDNDPIVNILTNEEYKIDESHSNHYVTIIPRYKKNKDVLEHDCKEELNCDYYKKYYKRLRTKVEACIIRSKQAENEWQTMFMYSSDVISKSIFILYVGYI